MFTVFDVFSILKILAAVVYPVLECEPGDMSFFKLELYLHFTDP